MNNSQNNIYVVLDTETTGLKYEDGEQIIEIGAVKLQNNNNIIDRYHTYIKPKDNKEVSKTAIDVHGITNEFLQDKPLFTEIVNDFLDFINDATCIICHNAEFDINFINYQLKELDTKTIKTECVIDTMRLAMKLLPNKKYSLDNLCKIYKIDASSRIKHGALIDAELTAKLFFSLYDDLRNKINNFPEDMKTIDFYEEIDLEYWTDIAQSDIIRSINDMLSICKICKLLDYLDNSDKLEMFLNEVPKFQIFANCLYNDDNKGITI